MIAAKFIFGNSLITGFEISGHSGYAQEGSDIVCASVSSVCYMVANTLTEVMKIPAEIEIDDALMKLSLDSNGAEKAKDILSGLLLHIEELEKMYPNFIKIERGA